MVTVDKKMFVVIQSDNIMHISVLPEEIAGSHELFAAYGSLLVFVEGVNGQWMVSPSEGCTLVLSGSDDNPRSVLVDPSEQSVVSVVDSNRAFWTLIFLAEHHTVSHTITYGFANDMRLLIGRSEDAAIRYDNPFISAHHALISWEHDSWQLVDSGSKNGTFINGKRVPIKQVCQLDYGDTVEILDLRLTVGNHLFSLVSLSGSVVVNQQGLVVYQAVSPTVDRTNPELDKDYFYPALRFIRTIQKKNFIIDAPPQPVKLEETSLAMKIGPSFVMALASVLSAVTFIMMMSEQNTSMVRALPMIAMAAAMLSGSVLWPMINSRTQEKKRLEDEAKRRSSYSQYLSKIRGQIVKEMSLQREILIENRISVKQCLEMAARRDPHLMDRTPLHEDFLQVRVGLGDEPFEADIRFPDQHFSVDEDDLKGAVDSFAAEPRDLKDVPLVHPLLDKHILGIVGEEQFTTSYTRGLIIQLAAQYSYENLKFVVLCDQEQREDWLFASHLPHIFSNDKQIRFFACGLEEADSLGMALERVFDSRRGVNQFEAKEAKPYFIVICTSEQLAARAAFVQNIVSEPSNLGVSLISLSHEMRELPKECKTVVGVIRDKAYLLDRDDPTGTRHHFKPDIFVTRSAAENFAVRMSSLRLRLESESEKLPSRLSFLEMYGAGNIGYFNFASQWQASNASASLACIVGSDVQGDPFLLNLHEKSHGPHGLIAGTTGSGKSEFIITYILSMAMTYSPNDVAFVLIDYKGGGLAKAFDNEHVRLPHLAGIITNLDGRAISRSLVSIQSELKRRQALFNQARDVAGGENVDIYTYLDLFRQGKMKEPCPHLFIVADEFAELKQQEPEFMDELISAARIGRSLGVHLILATQKPSGVVNDQIWSNARFKVCLKVADAADSNEMIRRPDAAELVEAGRFYLLVGFNEYFALGQSGYSGTKYVEKTKLEPEKDDTVTLISNTGTPLVSVAPAKENTESGEQPESIVVLEAIEKTADTLGMKARQLWLNPIPELITVDDTIAKYIKLGDFSQKQDTYDLEPVIGELDDPERQNQSMLTLPLSRGGNALLYGTADSGVESLLMSTLYSLIKCHTAETLNLYVLDFGSEALRAFAPAPQVGDVICAGEDEKIMRFFNFIEAEIARRRTLFSTYGGSFERYAQEHDDKPSILVVVNNVGTLREMYPQLDDRIVRFTQQAGRSGIHLIVTAENTSALLLRMKANFRQIVAVNLPDNNEYGMVFASMHGIVAPRGDARGLIQLEEGLFEFQGCHLTLGGDEYGAANELAQQVKEQHEEDQIEPAPSVPVAPKAVSVDDLLRLSHTDDRIPYGVVDSSLSVASLDFGESPLTRFVYQKKKQGVAFAQAFLKIVTQLSTWDVVLLDMAGIFGDTKPQGCYLATRKDDVAKVHLSTVMKRAEEDVSCKRILLLVTGIGSYLGRLDFEFGTSVKEFLHTLKENSSVSVVLFDSSVDTGYSYEDWFKTHLTNKDGIWIGPGIDSQNAINTDYNNKFIPDAAMRRSKGYFVDGGAAELVHLASIEDSEEEGE